MLSGTHMIVAGYAGELIGNPFLAFLCGIFIHLLLDAIPHFDTTDGGKATKRQIALLLADLVVAFFVILYILKADFSLTSPFFWGAFGGVLPDIIDVLPPISIQFHKTKFGKKFHKFHDSIQKVRLSPIPGLSVQVAIIALVVYLYLR